MLTVSRFHAVLRFCAILACCALLGACATYYGAAEIVSDPPGAEVINLDDGSIIGTTPVTFVRKDGSDRRQTIILRFKKEGFYDKTSSFWMTMRHRSAEQAQQDAQRVEVELQLKRPVTLMPADTPKARQHTPINHPRPRPADHSACRSDGCT